MSLKRPTRLLFLLTALTIILLTLSTSAHAVKLAEVTSVRHWSNPTYTRIVIDVGSDVEYYHHLLKEDVTINVPHRRLYVDIYDTTLSDGLKKKISINDGLLKAARAGQYKSDTVRVVLDIESIEDYKIFTLSNPFRIIIDVTGKGFKGEGGEMSKTGDLHPPTADSILKTSHKVRKIVIDPGHGGKDPGAIGKSGLKEKDVTLRISKLLKKSLKKRTKAKVILTRKRDVYIPLEERTAIANTAEADLFISVHVNASPKRKASGVETYYLDVSNDRRSIQVAARENAASTKATGDLQYILRDLMRTANRNDSSALATHIQSSLVKALKKKYRGVHGNGVKGAPFYVLVRTNMPSILVEVSFISNAKEEGRLKSEKYLTEIARGITDGVLGFVNGRDSN
ncbi:MAG: N-acetylmuramoyl-L-alanine amidase [Thermodesulfobacteriota bacterium]